MRTDFEKELKKHVKNVGRFIGLMDEYLEKDKDIPERVGKTFAYALNELDKQNDAIRYFCLRVDYRKDNKEKFFKECLKP